MYTNIIFDIDGTLIDSEKAIISSLQKVLQEELGRKYCYDDLKFTFGIPGAVSLSKLGIENIKDVSKRWNQYIIDSYDKIKIFPGIEKLLIELNSRGIISGIVTSKTREELVSDFAPFGLMKYFKCCICADDTNKHKPEPDPILKFINVSKAYPSQALYIGDTIYDCKCARAASISFALALWGAGNKEIDADYRLEEPTGLLEILNLQTAH